IAAEHDGDRAVIALVVEHLLIVTDRLRPAGGRRILRPDAAAHRQRRAAGGIGEVEDDANIAAVRIAAGPAHGRTESILERNAEREQERARAVIAAGAVARMIEPRAEH